MKRLARFIRQLFCLMHSWEHESFSAITNVNIYRCRKCRALQAWHALTKESR